MDNGCVVEQTQEKDGGCCFFADKSNRDAGEKEVGLGWGILKWGWLGGMRGVLVVWCG